MAEEQDWSAYADQATLADNDTILARTVAGGGVEVPGSALIRTRADGRGLSYRPSAAVGETQHVMKGAAGGYGAGVSFVSALAVSGVEKEMARITADGEAPWSSADAASQRAGLRFYTTANGALSVRLYIDGAGNVTPASDNGQIFGWPSARWAVVYAATGTINTSDGQEKRWRGVADEAELRAARRISAELGFFQWKDAIAVKGGDWADGGARLHFGVRAQAVWTIMAEEGLVDPIGDDGRPGAAPYAFLCFDEWDDRFEQPIDPETGEPTGPRVKVLSAGCRYGLRVDQLALFLIAAQEQRLAALEAAA